MKQEGGIFMFGRAYLTIILILILSVSTASQTFDRPTGRFGDQERRDRMPSMMDEGMDRHYLMESMLAETVLDGPIDPSEYYVGPMDLFSIAVIGAVPLQLITRITPEGSIVIPMVGEVPVQGMTLKEAKDVIYHRIRERYKEGEIYVTLVSPRFFSVHVTGTVRNPGSHIVSAIDRADMAIYFANFHNQRDRQQPVFEEIPTFSMRNIKIFRENGDTIHVDLARFYVTGDLEYNPRLRDGDIIVVPTEQMAANSIGIFGGVISPGRVEFREGDSLSLLIKLARGFKETAVIDSIEIARFTDDRESVERFTVDGRKILRGEADVALQRNDRVFVRERRNVRREYTVAVRGEVMHQGSYPITRENTTLSEVIQTAGGFTEYASLNEAVVLRDTPHAEFNPIIDVSMSDPERLRRLSPMRSDYIPYFEYESRLRQNLVAVDFIALFHQGDDYADITLRDGDLIIIPSTQNNVFVFGQVINPGYITHLEGMGVDYYLSRAGGMAERAKGRHVAVIKAGTNEWVDPDDTEIEPGDAIWVPRRPERGSSYYYEIFRDALQISTAAATIYLLILQITKE